LRKVEKTGQVKWCHFHSPAPSIAGGG